MFSSSTVEMVSVAWWSLMLLAYVGCTSAEQPDEDGPSLYPSYFETEREFDDKVKETEEYEKENTPEGRPVNECLELCDAETIEVDSDVTDRDREKRQLYIQYANPAPLPTVQCPLSLAPSTVCDFHACCASSYSYKQITDATDMYNLPVRIIQLANAFQGFFIEKCVQSGNCGTICSCKLRVHFHRAVIKDADGLVKATHVGIPTSCKCYNV